MDTERSSADVALTASLHNIVNDYYAKDISRKVTSALHSKMVRGDYIGNYAPYGYLQDPHNKNHLIIDDKTAPIIKRIFEMRSAGMSYMGINRVLNDEGVLSPGEYRKTLGIITNNNKKSRKILWNKHMITEILSNDVYIGNLTQRRSGQCLYEGKGYHINSEEEHIKAKDTHEAIIDYELFASVQEINQASVKKSSLTKGKYSHLPKTDNIYGKKFVCAECGRTMKLHRSISSKKDKAYFTFKCPTYAEHGTQGCYNIKISKADLDTAVLELINKQISVFIDLKGISDLIFSKKSKRFSSSKKKSRLADLKNTLNRKERILSDMYLDLKSGILSQADFSDSRAIILSDIEKIKNEIKEAGIDSLELEKQSVTRDLYEGIVKEYGI